MLIKWFNVLLFGALAGAFWYANWRYDQANLNRGYQTFLMIMILYAVFRVLVPEIIRRRVRDVRTKYSLQKVTSIVYLASFFIILLTIWVEDPQALLVTYGLIGAGVAIALQDFFKNFVGGVSVFANNLYRVGDRIEIDGMSGDVIDVGVLYTTLMEIKEWIQGDQTTGRMTIIPNGKILHGAVKNFTKDHSFLWDELEIPITYDSDWRRAGTLMEEIAAKETKEVGDLAEQQLKHLGGRYYYMRRETEPMINIRPTDNWVTVHVRYVTDARGRRMLKTKLYRQILEVIEHAPDIKIASTTLDIIGFPGSKNEDG